MLSLRRIGKLFVLCLLLLGFTTHAHADEDRTTLLKSLLEQSQAAPTDSRIAKQLEAFVSSGLPNTLPSASLIGLPADVIGLPDAIGSLIVPKPYLLTETVEPQNGWKFPKVSYLYLNDTKNNNEIRLFCRVHYTIPEDAAFAKRVAGLLSLAHQTLVEKTGHAARNSDEPIDVWLCRNGQNGGEQWRNNLYFYDLDALRSSIEWIREITHEYSHLALPPIGGYKSPEYWANGYLGERLLVHWFEKTPGRAAIVGKVWGDFSGVVNFDRLLIAPPLATYRRIGPNSAWLARTDSAGMQYLIGQALTIDSKYGSRVLGELLYRLPRFREAHASDLVVNLREVLQHKAP